MVRWVIILDVAQSDGSLFWMFCDGSFLSIIEKISIVPLLLFLLDIVVLGPELLGLLKLRSINRT